MASQTPGWTYYEKSLEAMLTSGEPMNLTLEGLSAGYQAQRANLFEREAALAKSSGRGAVPTAPPTFSGWLKGKNLPLSGPARQMLLDGSMRQTLKMIHN